VTSTRGVEEGLDYLNIGAVNDARSADKGICRRRSLAASGRR
jgi:hypothetical protein